MRKKTERKGVRLISGWNVGVFGQLGKMIKEVALGTLGISGGPGGRCEVGPFTQSRKVMAPAECRQGVGLGAQFLNGWLARPGPRSPLGNLHSQEQSVFHQNRKNHRRKMHM